MSSCNDRIDTKSFANVAREIIKKNMKQQPWNTHRQTHIDISRKTPLHCVGKSVCGHASVRACECTSGVWTTLKQQLCIQNELVFVQ